MAGKGLPRQGRPRTGSRPAPPKDRLEQPQAGTTYGVPRPPGARHPAPPLRLADRPRRRPCRTLRPLPPPTRPCPQPASATGIPQLRRQPPGRRPSRRAGRPGRPLLRTAHPRAGGTCLLPLPSAPGAEAGGQGPSALRPRGSGAAGPRPTPGWPWCRWEQGLLSVLGAWGGVGPPAPGGLATGLHWARLHRSGPRSCGRRGAWRVWARAPSSGLGGRGEEARSLSAGQVGTAVV
jgi:hypothetical protein